MGSFRFRGRLLHTVPLSQYGTPGARQALLQSFITRCVHRSPDQVLVSPSGKPIGWLVDARPAMLDPAMMAHLGALLWQHLEPMLPFQFACMEVAGIPLMTALQTQGVAFGHHINGVVLRKERKTYGRQRDMEGELNQLPIVMLDDLLNSGSTIRRASSLLALRNRSIAHIVVLVDFENQGRTLVSAGPIPSIFSLFTLGDLGLTRSKHPLDIFPDPLDPVWHRTAQGPSLFDVVPKSSPVVDDQTVYFGCDSGEFCALDQQTGGVRWKYHVPTHTRKGIWSTPVVAKDLITFGAYDGCLYALDRLTGQRRWRWCESDWIGSSPAFAPDLELLFIGLEHALVNAKGGVVAVDASTGGQRWVHRTLRYVHGSPLYLQECSLVVTGDNGGDLVALHTRTGEPAWVFSAEDSIKARPTYDPVNQAIFFGSFDNSLYALNARDGTLRWKFPTDGPIYSTPFLLNGVVYVGSTDKHLYLVEAQSGSLIKRIRTSGKVFGSPVMAGGSLYFGATDGIVYQIEPSTRELTGKHQLTERITNRLAYSDRTGLLFVVSYDNSITALRPRNLAHAPKVVRDFSPSL